MSYTPRYDDDAIDQHSDQPNISGESPRANLIIEERAQRQVAESDTWLLARNMGSDWNPEDSRPALEALGFEVKMYNDLFYEVVPPDGWTKRTEGYHTYICDTNGKQRAYQFFKGAWYDTCASISFWTPEEV